MRTALVAALVVLAGCAEIIPRGLRDTPPVPEGPGRRVSLDPPAAPERAAPAIPADLLRPGASLTLGQVVDIALQNNPLTRASYLQARSAREDLNIRRAAYYPTLDATATAGRSQQSVDGREASPRNTFSGGLDLQYLLFDLGGRAAGVEEARLAALAADWAHNSTLQDVALEVETAFFGYLNAKAQIEAARATVKQAETALEAAERRRAAGVATIAEVLQAKTALSQARFDLQLIEGQVHIVRGSLATAMGVPADTPYDVGTLPADIPIERAAATVEELISAAKLRRPDLAAARLLAEKAEARIRKVRAEGLPRLMFSGNVNRTYYDPDEWSDYRDNWSVGVLLEVPLFTGFANRHGIRKAEEDAGISRADAESLEQRVILQVWASYYGLKTAAQLIQSSRDLLASAEQSERVALGRYKEGAGTIVDLLVAQSALARARAQEIAARSAWFVALAQLARDTGAAAPFTDPQAFLEGKMEP